MDPRLDDDFPFHSVGNALQSGYSAEAVQLYQQDSTFAQLRGGSVRLKAAPYWEGATAHDRAAEAGKVVGLVRRTLRLPLLLAVEAYYLPNDKAQLSVVFQKQYRCSGLIPTVRARLSAPPEDKHIAACISHWARLHEKTSDTTRELGIHERTARRIRTANSGYPRQIEEMLNAMLDEGKRQLGGPMREYGLIP